MAQIFVDGGDFTEHFRICIIGGGPAGLTAALYSSRGGMTTLLLEKQYAGGQMVTTGKIDNYPGFSGVSGTKLTENMLKSAESFNPTIVYEEAIKAELSSAPKIIHTPKTSYSADAVIIATGGFPRKLGIPGEERLLGRGVSYCAQCDGAFFRNRTAVVAGGGDSAATNALYLDGLCKTVYLVHRRDRLRASPALTSALEKSGVKMIFERQITEITGADSVTGVELESPTGEKSSLSCDGVFIAAGRIPESDIFSGQLSLNKNGFIIAGEDTITDIPGVFTAGDVRSKGLRQIVTAASDGAAAVYSAEEYFKTLK